MTTSSLIELFRLISQLKSLQRTGWVRAKVSRPETVASHSYGVALLALVLSGFDPHTVELALVHDLAESLVGDITPKCGVPLEEKADLEDAAFQRIRDETLGGTEVGHKLYALFREYEEAQTPAAVLVHQIDKLDMVLQALMYEQSQQELDLSEFFTAREELKLSKLRAIGEEILRQRSK